MVTGANSGIGLAAAREFARRGARVGLVGRDVGRLDAALAAVRAEARPDAAPEAFQCDFCVLEDVRRLATALASAYPSIAVLCNNAGGVQHSRQLTVDHHEVTIQANHLSPFLLTNLLRDQLRGGRVVNTASTAHRYGQLDADDLDCSGRYRAMAVYGASKQANILFAAEAARRWSEILSFSYHPGVVRSRFGRGNGLFETFYRVAPLLRTPEQGADTMVWLAGAPRSQVDNGAYYVNRSARPPRRHAADGALAAKLWEVSEVMVGLAGEEAITSPDGTPAR
ncbi:SDR family oxidoreductase [Rugosimonospora acidiphila]|uniref:SDR family oxidoreductase n=1 Tax=Rugosimonospora acidiphila TaxID=556531 RepID=A0ABP9SBJ2_9ACTN